MEEASNHGKGMTRTNFFCNRNTDMDQFKMRSRQPEFVNKAYASSLESIRRPKYTPMFSHLNQGLHNKVKNPKQANLRPSNHVLINENHKQMLSEWISKEKENYQSLVELAEFANEKKQKTVMVKR